MDVPYIIWRLEGVGTGRVRYRRLCSKYATSRKWQRADSSPLCLSEAPVRHIRSSKFNNETLPKNANQSESELTGTRMAYRRWHASLAIFYITSLEFATFFLHNIQRFYYCLIIFKQIQINAKRFIFCVSAIKVALNQIQFVVMLWNYCKQNFNKNFEKILIVINSYIQIHM